MKLDPRIQERFQEEYDASIERQAEAQRMVDVLTAQVVMWTDKVNEEIGIQAAIDETMTALGNAVTKK